MTNSLHQLAHDIQTRIRELAYVMWESAGRHQGMAMEYWLAAEQEVQSSFQTATEMLLPTPSAAETTVSDAAAKPQPHKPAIEKAAVETTAVEMPAVKKATPAPAESAVVATRAAPSEAAPPPQEAVAKPATRRTGTRSKPKA